MSKYVLAADVERMILERLNQGGYSNENEVLREALRALADEDDDVSAVGDAIAEWRQGDAGVPLSAAFRQLRGETTE